MYFALILLPAVSMFFLLLGFQGKKMWIKVLGVLPAVLMFVFFEFFGFREESLWFEAAEYLGHFGRPSGAAVFSAAGGGTLALAIVWLLTRHAFPNHSVPRRLSRAAAVVFGALWGWRNWKHLLFFWYGVSGEAADPLLGQDVGFYLFQLPMLEQLYRLLLILFTLGLGTLLISLYVRRNHDGRLVWRLPDLSRPEEAHRNRLLYRGLAAFFFLLAWGRYLDQFHLMYSEHAVAGGADGTEVYVRLHACRILIVFLGASGLFLLIPFLRGRFRRWMIRCQAPREIVPLTPALLAGFCTAVVWLTALGIVPPLFERLHIRPGVISPAAPCMVHTVVPVADVLTPERIEENRVLVILIDLTVMYIEPICLPFETVDRPAVRPAMRIDSEETPAVVPEETKPIKHRSQNYEKD